MKHFRAEAVSLSLVILIAFLGVNMTPNPANAGNPTTAPSDPFVRLWEHDAPGAQGTRDADIPTLTPFLIPTKNATGAAVIVCPGGAYGHLADHEGKPVALWLNTLGIQGFVLKYRLGPKYHHPVEMEDGQRAVRYVRSHAAQWHLDPKRIGILGFSAGGHLASTVATHFDDGIAGAPDPVDRVSCRPDLAILMYPVITMRDPFAHLPSRKNLLGDNPDPSLLAFLSSDEQVTKSTPPCFLVHTMDDHTSPVENSLLFAAACRKNHVPVELHLFEHGKHGFGLGKDDPVLSTWPGLAALWLQRHGFAKIDK
jgi:acetyl esterase/lipase